MSRCLPFLKAVCILAYLYWDIYFVFYGCTCRLIAGKCILRLSHATGPRVRFGYDSRKIGQLFPIICIFEPLINNIKLSVITDQRLYLTSHCRTLPDTLPFCDVCFQHALGILNAVGEINWAINRLIYGILPNGNLHAANC